MLFPLWMLGRGSTVSVPPTPPFLLQEDLFYLLQEDNDKIIIESGNATADFLLQEDSFYILQQNGSRLII